MKKLRDILIDIRPESAREFDTSVDFFADGLLDSFDLITLVSDLDRAYGISIDGSDIVPENFVNLAAIAALLARLGVTP